MKGAVLFILGAVVGGAAMFAVIINAAPAQMIRVEKSTLWFEETVTAIQDGAQAHGWQVPQINNIQESLAKAGHDIDPIKVISLCKPDYAAELLAQDGDRRVAAMIPCRIGVFETGTGQVLVTRLNITGLSRLFGGNIKDVMQKVAGDEAELLKDITTPL